MPRNKIKERQVHPEGPLITLDDDQRLAIKTARGALEQKDLAARIGVTPATISNIESGKHTKQVRAGIYAKLVKVLRIAEVAPQGAAAFDETVDILVGLTPTQLDAVRLMARSLRDSSKKSA